VFLEGGQMIGGKTLDPIAGGDIAEACTPEGSG